MSEKKKFALIGAAGYIAPRHMKAIKDTGNDLVAIMDVNDSVGIIDSYFPSADYFSEFEIFDRHVEKLRHKGTPVDYVSICSPNYLHDAHIRFALRSHTNAICEKPLVLNPWNIDALQEIEKETGKKVFNILQLRLHPEIIKLKNSIEKNKSYDIDLTYMTSRGNWYGYSWKGDIKKSGGMVTNIGIHFYDMLIWIFGGVESNQVNYMDDVRATGILKLKNANVRWFLSINPEDLPDDVKAVGKRTFRSIKVGDREVEFSEGFTDLHTASYQAILDGKGFGSEEARPSIDVVYNIRHAKPIGKQGDYHPFFDKIKI